MLSICAIVHNEEERIHSFVMKVKPHSDRVIIVDNNSTDNTAVIAKSLGCTVIHNTQNTVDKARDLYLQYASDSWILILDLDEEVFPEDFCEIQNVINHTDGKQWAFYLPMHHYFGEGHWATTYHCRLFYNNCPLEYSRKIHGSVYKDLLSAGKKFALIDIPIHHYDGVISINRNKEKRNRNLKLLKEQLVNKTSPSLYCYLSHEQAALGDYDRALTSIEQAIQLDTDHHSYAYLQKAYLLAMQGSFEEALKFSQLQKDLVETKKDDPRKCYFEYLSDKSEFIKIWAQIESNQNVAAIETLKSLAAKHPRISDYWLNLFLLTNENDYLCKAISINPNILNPQIFTPINPYNIYESQNSIIWVSDIKRRILSAL